MARRLSPLSFPALGPLAFVAAVAAGATTPAATGAAVQPVQSDKAPDGRPGFGTRLAIKDVRGLFYRPSDEETAFLKGIQALESEVRVLAAALAKRYEDSGYYALLERGVEPTLTALHAAWFEALEDPVAALGAGDRRSRALVSLVFDVRFRVRARVLSGVEREYDELDGGLGLLRAHFDGYADLRDVEVRSIGRRVDLAAAWLRAVRLDLEALRKDAAGEMTPGRKLIEDFARGKHADAVGVRAVLEALDEQERAMGRALFTSRLLPEVEALLAWRDEQVGAGAAALVDVRMFVPDTAEGQKAPPDVMRMKKNHRYEAASQAAIQGLTYDPMSADLNWFAGKAMDYLWGVVESRRFFDRYLALQGVRAHEHRSYEYSKLDERARHALERVQQGLNGLPR